MLQHLLTKPRSSITSLCFVALLGILLPEGAANAGERKDRRKDMATCQEFGARYGTPQFSECMLAQQRRRDVKKLESLERTRLTSQIAKDGQLMAERARQQRCDRDPSRRECR